MPLYPLFSRHSCVKQWQFCLNNGWGLLDLAFEWFFGPTIVTFIQRSQRALHYLSQWAELWSSLSHIIAELLLSLQSPFPSSLRNKCVFQNFIYSLQFQRLASRKLQSSLYFVFLWSNDSFLFLFSLLSLVSVFLVVSSIIPLYIIKFLYSVCHCAQAVLCSVTSNSFPSETPHPNSSLKLLAEAFVLSASPYVYKLEISSLCLPSKAICCLRPFHELVYSCG